MFLTKTTKHTELCQCERKFMYAILLNSIGSNTIDKQRKVIETAIRVEKKSNIVCTEIFTRMRIFDRYLFRIEIHSKRVFVH